VPALALRTAGDKRPVQPWEFQAGRKWRRPEGPCPCGLPSGCRRARFSRSAPFPAGRKESPCENGMVVHGCPPVERPRWATGRLLPVCLQVKSYGLAARSRVICPGGVGFEASAASGGGGAGLVSNPTPPGIYRGERSRVGHGTWPWLFASPMTDTGTRAGRILRGSVTDG
jgi:hypothetical protein